MASSQAREMQLQLSQQAPVVAGQTQKRYHLTENDLERMRNLRREDPDKWSVSSLSKKFDCSPVFTHLVVQGLAPEKGQQQKVVTEVIKSNWGKKRREAREDRELRKERWLKDT
jgi:hypothetical protein